MKMHEIPSFLINLDARHDRMHHMKTVQQRLGLRFQRIPAVDGRKLPFNDLPVAPYVRTSLQTGKRFSKIHLTTPGEVGCFLSHRAAWERVRDESQPCLIFEDDAEPNEHAARGLVQAIEEVKQGVFDLIVLGTHNGTFKSEKIVPIPKWTDTGELMTGSWAYVLSPETARRLLDASCVMELSVDLFLTTVVERMGFVQLFGQAHFWRGNDITHKRVEEREVPLMVGCACAGALVMLLLVVLYMRLRSSLCPTPA
jgi:glycosyl transferase family 25